MVVDGPWPGWARIASGRSISTSCSERCICAGSLVGKSTRPIEPANSVSPTIASFAAQGNAPVWLQYTAALLGRGQPLYLILFAVLIIFFSFFYTAIVLNPQDTADNLKRSGGFIPGIRPGERTAQHIDYVVTRITVVGALYLTVVALIPEMIHSQLNVSQFIGGTSLLIMVTVTLDTISQIQSHLIAGQYGALIEKSRLGGKRARARGGVVTR